MKLKIKNGRALVQAQEDWDEYNTKLMRLMKKLKKDAGATTIRQNYKGKGSQKARRQLWIRFKSGAVIDIWLDMGFVGLGGVVTNRPPGSDVTLSTKRISYEKRTPEQTYAEVVKVIKPWANPEQPAISDGGLDPKDIKKGLKIINKRNPEWGTWTVTGPTKGVARAWNIQRDRRGDEKFVDEAELAKFWKKA